MTEMTDLKPCPFCGGNAVLRKNKYSRGYYVTCLSNNCSMIIATCQRDTEEEAIKAWNRRAKDEADIPQTELVEEREQ